MHRIVVDGEDPPPNYKIPIAWTRWLLARVTPEREAEILAEVYEEWPAEEFW